MSARGQMTMRATVSRKADRSQKDDWGQAKSDRYQEIGTVPCRVWVKTSKHVTDEGKAVAVRDMRAMMPRGSDVRVGDQLEVSDRLGRVLYEGPLAVDHVNPIYGSPASASHLELMLTGHG